MKIRRCIGVLGGMGPQATVDFMSRVIAAIPAQDDADHIPLIVDQNPQVPSRISAIIEGTGEDPAPVLVKMAQRLQGAGAQALVMPCNTAHHFAPAIRAAVDIPFLDMIALSADAAAARTTDGATIGILASPAVQTLGLFDRALAAVGRVAAYPADPSELLLAIRMVKARGVSDQARAIFASASQDLLAQGVGVQLIACTEFSLLADATPAGVTALDTLDILVQATVKFATAGDE